jgi:hypothetical protein
MRIRQPIMSLSLIFGYSGDIERTVGVDLSFSIRITPL